MGLLLLYNVQILVFLPGCEMGQTDLLCWAAGNRFCCVGSNVLSSVVEKMFHVLLGVLWKGSLFLIRLFKTPSKVCEIGRDTAQDSTDNSSNDKVEIRLE